MPLDQLMAAIAQCAKIPRGINAAEAALNQMMDLQALAFRASTAGPPIPF